jgi:hypothetical protein
MNNFENLQKIFQPKVPTPPPVPSSPPPAEDLRKELKKSGKRDLSVELIASIQKSYRQVQQNDNGKPQKQKPPQMGLDEGWGGKGR